MPDERKKGEIAIEERRYFDQTLALVLDRVGPQSFFWIFLAAIGRYLSPNFSGGISVSDLVCDSVPNGDHTDYTKTGVSS